jgi:hypothetical protein
MAIHLIGLLEEQWQIFPQKEVPGIFAPPAFASARASSPEPLENQGVLSARFENSAPASLNPDCSNGKVSQRFKMLESRDIKAFRDPILVV